MSTLNTPGAIPDPAKSQSSATVTHLPYIPGYVWAKLVMLLYSLAMLGAGLADLVPNLALIASGRSVQAVAVAVVKERHPADGLEPEILRTPTAVQAAQERRDRTYVFWNEYKFFLPDGAAYVARAPFASQLKPHKPLFDDQGIPTTVWLVHDRADPSRIVLPLEFSTWFLPGMLAGFGLAGACVAGLLLSTARRPVDMPVLGSDSVAPASAYKKSPLA